MGNSTVVSEKDVVTSDKATLYMPAGDVFNELPTTLKDQIVALAKIKHSTEFLAGHNSDRDVRQFCVSWLRDTVSSLYEQKMKATREQIDKKARDYYLKLRERGISVAEASKAADYNPLT